MLNSIPLGETLGFELLTQWKFPNPYLIALIKFSEETSYVCYRFHYYFDVINNKKWISRVTVKFDSIILSNVTKAPGKRLLMLFFLTSIVEDLNPKLQHRIGTSTCRSKHCLRTCVSSVMEITFIGRDLFNVSTILYFHM